MSINELLGVRESYQAPTALMRALLDDGRRADFVQKYRDSLPNLEQEHLREYFMESQSDRKGDKQDYTPDAIGQIITGILGKRDQVLDIAGGIGGLTVHQWSANREGTYVVEEISSASLPFLLLNLLARRMNAVVIHGDSLERVAKEVYRIEYEELTTLAHTEETLSDYNLRGWVDEF
jgi:type I restriction enzyme M protein